MRMTVLTILRARRVAGDNPYNRTLSHHLNYVTSPAFLIAFLQFIDDLHSVLTCGQITSRYCPILVIERVLGLRTTARILSAFPGSDGQSEAKKQSSPGRSTLNRSCFASSAGWRAPDRRPNAITGCE